MELEDLKNNPTLIVSNLQITGPKAPPTTGTIQVQTRVVSPTSDVTHTESIAQCQNAVVAAAAVIGGLQGKTQRIEVASGGTANCYWLPWESGKVFMGQLANAHEYFFTYTINGCGFIIGGTPAQPLVAHANLESKRLDKAVEDAMKPGSKGMAGVATEQATIYEQFYANLAAKLIDLNQMSGVRLEVVTPQQYLIDAGAGFGALFGVNKNKGGAWEFYGNWAGQTKKIWP
jgi:hypothetical protein